MSSRTLYLRSTAGEDCGPGTRYALSQTAGTSGTQISVNTEVTWNIPQGVNWESGPFTPTLQVTVAAGGGPPSRIRVVLEQRSSTCNTLLTFVNLESSNLTAGTQQTVEFQDFIQVTQWSPGDIFLMRVFRSSGTRNITVTAESTDSFITVPQEVVIGSTLQHWTGSAWAPGEVRRWTGSFWRGAIIRRWTGTEWVDMP